MFPSGASRGVLLAWFRAAAVLTPLLPAEPTVAGRVFLTSRHRLEEEIVAMIAMIK